MLISTGIIVENYYCSCNDENTIVISQLIVENESTTECETCCNTDTEKNTCNSDGCGDSCSCNIPVINILILTTHFGENTVIQEIKYTKQLSLASSDSENFVEINDSEIDNDRFYLPPDNQYSGRFLLNFIQQLKFDYIA